MPSKRACIPCRELKVKCNLEEPTCGRCRKRNVECCYPLATDEPAFVFRDQNAFAERKASGLKKKRVSASASRRARSGSGRSRRSSSDLQIGPEERLGLQRYYPWLNDAALNTMPTAPLSKTLEERAVERFFVDWRLHPSNHGLTPGYMHDLPLLYFTACKGAILVRAVHAMAYATLRNTRNADDIPFSRLARTSYGTALSRMRAVGVRKPCIKDDRTMAGLLLIDNFEVMYTSRSEPLGPHGQAVKHFLDARGDAILYSSQTLAIWRVMHHRLQIFQLSQRRAPEPEQIEWVEKLRTDRPDSRMTADVLEICRLRARAHDVSKQSWDSWIEQTAAMQDLIESMIDLIRRSDEWMSSMQGGWKPGRHEARLFHPPARTDIPALPPVTTTHVLSHHDAWMTYMFNSYSTAQILLRETLIEVMQHAANLRERDLSTQESARIALEKQVIHVLSGNIIESWPVLLGFHQEDSPSGTNHILGSMAAKLFAHFSLWGLQEAELVPEEHKKIAAVVDDWIKTTQSLD